MIKKEEIYMGFLEISMIIAICALICLAVVVIAKKHAIPEHAINQKGNKIKPDKPFYM